MKPFAVRFGLCICLAVLPTVLQATAPPSVKFSASQTIACRDVTSAEFAAANPSQKLIEAEFRVSVLLWQGSEQEVDELLFVVASPQRRLRVVDFWPKTESATDIAGMIDRSETKDATRSLESGLRGTLSAAQGGVGVQVAPSAGATQSKHDGIKESYKLLPPRKLLVASGPLDGDFSVFFKLKPSTQSSLEGAKTFSCVFAVPADWRGDWAALTCLAKGQNKRQLTTRVEECGRDSFLLGLHLEGDAEARLLAEQVDQSQARLKQPAGDTASTATRSGWPSFVKALGFSKSSQGSDTARREVLKPLPTLQESLDALQALSGRFSPGVASPVQ